MVERWRKKRNLFFVIYLTCILYSVYVELLLRRQLGECQGTKNTHTKKMIQNLKEILKLQESEIKVRTKIWLIKF